MNEEVMQQLMASAEKLASAAEGLERSVGRLEAEHEALAAKVDRIVAAIDEGQHVEHDHGAADELKRRVAELERDNADLKAQSGRLSRKTLSPIVSALLSKNFAESERIETAALDKALSSLSVEQRIAVKAEMARAGILE